LFSPSAMKEDHDVTIDAVEEEKEECSEVEEDQ
jgi:hypothetical protein